MSQEEEGDEGEADEEAYEQESSEFEPERRPGTGSMSCRIKRAQKAPKQALGARKAPRRPVLRVKKEESS